MIDFQERLKIPCSSFRKKVTNLTRVRSIPTKWNDLTAAVGIFIFLFSNFYKRSSDFYLLLRACRSGQFALNGKTRRDRLKALE